jgi:hypothetical protein
MDRTLSVVLAVLVVASVIFLAVISLTAYMGITYRATLSSTYDYQVTIASDAAITNVTLYLPIPARGPENSVVLEGIGAGGLSGVPRDWNTSLIGTEKFTMLEVTAREMAPTPVGKPYLLSITSRVRGPIETRNAGSDDLVLVPSALKRPVTCVGMDTEVSPEMQCGMYEGPIYADFTAPKNVRLMIFISLTGKNSWDVLGPSSNEYQEGLQVSFSNGVRGWHNGSGNLITGIGDYGIDFWVQGWATGISGGGSRQRAGLPPEVEGAV